MAQRYRAQLNTIASSRAQFPWAIVTTKMGFITIVAIAKSKLAAETHAEEYTKTGAPAGGKIVEIEE